MTAPSPYDGPNAESWRALAEKAVGASIETQHVATLDGIDIAPLYRRRGHDLPRPWRGTADWSAAQRVDHPDAVEANRLAVLDLEGGADALTLVFEAGTARGFGLPDGIDLDLVLEGIDLDFIGVRLDAGASTLAAAKAMVELLKRRRLTSANIALDLGLDPIAMAARSGLAPATEALSAGVKHAHALHEEGGLSGRPVLADGRPYHEAGAGAAQELAAILATGVALLRLSESAGLSLEAARGSIAVLATVDADVFVGLAKVRAIRRLWARIEAACGLEPKPLRLHAETAWRMMTRRDPWTNVMRTTAATVAAALGGADVITVLPFTLPIGLPDDYARRLARNVQRVLIDEANLGKVDDPAAGAGGFESLTDGLCEQAWALFQEIEREGGILASLKARALQRRIAETAARRARTVATLGQGIVGTSRFPSLQPSAVAVFDLPRALDEKSGGLPTLRDAEPFEALRDSAERMGETPSVFLATLGAPADFGAHATYAANFLAAAGIAALSSTETRDTPTLIEAYRESGTPIACLCGSDKAYAGEAATLVEGLRQVGARRILLAGKADIAGVDAFIHDGCDAPQVLDETSRAAVTDSNAG